MNLKTCPFQVYGLMAFSIFTQCAITTLNSATPWLFWKGICEWEHGDRTVDKLFALNTADPYLNPSIPYTPHKLPGMIIKCRAISKPWTPLGVVPQNKICDLLSHSSFAFPKDPVNHSCQLSVSLNLPILGTSCSGNNFTCLAFFTDIMFSKSVYAIMFFSNFILTSWFTKLFIMQLF